MFTDSPFGEVFLAFADIAGTNTKKSHDLAPTAVSAGLAFARQRLTLAYTNR